MSQSDSTTPSLTKNQLLVLEALRSAGQAAGAYQLLEVLRDKGFKAPLQVYRTLNQLAERSLVHRIESLNAWMACCDDHHHGTPIFAICNDCGNVTEYLDHSLTETITALPTDTGFQPDRSIIEIYGQCGACVASS